MNLMQYYDIYIPYVMDLHIHIIIVSNNKKMYVCVPLWQLQINSEYL
jgi:hypothetical protein